MTTPPPADDYDRDGITLTREDELDADLEQAYSDLAEARAELGTVHHDLEAAQNERNIVQGQLDDCSENYEVQTADLARTRALLEQIRGTVNEQAEDDGLWFFAQTAAEAYQQQELRKLHTVIEGVAMP